MLSFFTADVTQLCGGYHVVTYLNQELRSPNSDSFLNGTYIDCLWTLRSHRQGGTVSLRMYYEYLSQTKNCSQGMIQVSLFVYHSNVNI